MVALADGPQIDFDLLAPKVRGVNGAAAIAPGDATMKRHVEALEASLLREALVRHRGNKSRAAEELGLSRVGVRAELSRYGLDREGRGRNVR